MTRWLADRPAMSAALHALGGMGGALLALVAIAALHKVLTGRPLEESLGGSEPVWIVIVAAAAAGLLVGFLRGRRPL